MGSTLKYILPFVIIGAFVAGVVTGTIPTYFFTKNYYRNHSPGAQAVAAAQSSADSLRRGYSFLERRLEATQESLGTASARLSSLESNAAAVQKEGSSSTSSNRNNVVPASNAQDLKSIIDNGGKLP